MSEVDISTQEGFAALGLGEPILKALGEIGYETPSPIQREIIPHVLSGRDVVGQAQTGTGKTAAFALPLLTRIIPGKTSPQVLVLVPTRELAIQVAEAFQRYAAHLPGFHVLPIYGGQGYGSQFRQLRRGVHVIIATPGRLCDHLRRETFHIDNLECLVIDEADEMLRMGFIDEVEWILEQSGPDRQIALFSATMPDPIRRIAKRHLKDPVEITIKAQATTAALIRQRYWMVSGLHKLDALTRILEGEVFDGILCFVRTKTATVELSTKLEARGFAAAPLNGDIPQNQREQTVERLKNGDIDILVATDVAARGLDVKRISHVINYDIPYDVESYVHRIGRTGRAGRTGEAILFVAPRERRLLQTIEKTTRQKIDLMQLPTRESINSIRMTKFKQRITDTLAVEDLGLYYQILEEYRQEHNISALEIASALAHLAQGDLPLLLDKNVREEPAFEPAPSRKWTGGGDTVRYRMDVGFRNGVKPGQIVGAIANEGGIDGKAIQRIRIFDLYSTVELPANLGEEVFKALSRTRVCGRPIQLTPATGEEESESGGRGKESGNPPFKKFKSSKFRKFRS
ncbi:MAG: DEAD/DEAH box helicase [Candidatus Sumerlaeia bacterium]|nr:DEAD/DEAH box helicase [Candidatus Sumerlaeia bacterium]